MRVWKSSEARGRVRVRVRVKVKVRVRARCFVVTGGHKMELCVAEGGGRGITSRLWLERRLYNMLTVMLGGDLDIGSRI